MNEATLRAIQRASLLKRAEAVFRRQKGPNPAHPWGQWGERPRGGARWGAEEIDELMASFWELAKANPVGKLNEQPLCELAWRHGRSADAMRTKLYELLGWRQYYLTFREDL